MRFVLLTAALWASAPLAAEYGPPPQPCKLDRDCPGALLCVSGQCLSKPAGNSADVAILPGPKSEPKITNYGINLDAGVPDGLGFGLLWRPAYFLRVGGSATYNGAGFGARGTVTLQLFDFVISPSLTLDGGHYWGSNFLGLVQQAIPTIADDPTAVALLQNVPYDYANLQVGIEVGSTQHFMFYLRAGGSYLQGAIPNSGRLLSGVDPQGGAIEAENLVIRAIIPSAKLGIVAFF